MKIEHIDDALTINGLERMSAHDVEHLIRLLAEARERMSPPVPMSIRDAVQEDSQTIVIERPNMAIRHLHSGDVLISVRHPGLGWLSITLDNNDARSMAEFVTSKGRRAMDFLGVQLSDGAGSEH